MIFCWFVGLDLNEEVWDATSFTKHRQRLIDSEVGQAFLSRTVELAERKGLLRDERAVADGTLVKAYMSMGRFRTKDQDEPHSGGISKFNFMKRGNQTHESKSDSD